MNLFSNLSIRNKLVLIIVIISSGVTILGMVLEYYMEKSRLKETFVNQALLDAKLISYYCGMPLEFNNKEAAFEILNELSNLPVIYDGLLFTLNDSLFADYHKSESNVKQYPDKLKEVKYFTEKDWLHVLQPINYKDKEYGYLYIRASISLQEINKGNAVRHASIILLMIFLALALSSFFHRFISDPILNLSQLVKKVSINKDYSLRIEKQSKDEIGILYDEFNLMLETIEVAHGRLRNNQIYLKESYVKYKTLADYTYDWEFWKGTDNKFIYVSPSCEKIAGYTNNEFIDNSLLLDSLIIEEHKSLWREHNKDTMNKIAHEEPLEFRIKTKTGEIKWVSHVCRPVFNDEGEFLGTRGTNRDITEQKQTQQKILNAIIQTEENERKRVAQDLHDGIGPVLSTVKLFIQTYIASDNEEFKKKVEVQLIAGIDDALSQVSAISNNLSPHVLQDFGLESAIQKFIGRLKKVTNINIDFNYNFNDNLDKDIETTLYRVVIELVNNSIKHADATKISIMIDRVHDFVQLIYTDNGKGFDIDSIKQKASGMGLFNIENRIESFNGFLKFEKGEDNGIAYNILIPAKI